MPDDIFYSHFRMGISTLKKLYKMLQLLWRTSATGRPGITLKESLYATLWKLGNQNSFREISDRFNIGRGTVYRAFVKIICLINKLKGVRVEPFTSISFRAGLHRRNAHSYIATKKRQYKLLKSERNAFCGGTGRCRYEIFGRFRWLSRSLPRCQYLEELPA